MARAPESKGLIEDLLMVAIGGYAVSIFFSQTGIAIFGPLCLIVILVWKYVLKYEDADRIPKYLLLAVSLFVIDVFRGAVISDDRINGFSELRKYWNIFLAGLLYTAPLDGKRRKWMVAVFLVAASAAGISGIRQFFIASQRGHGFAHPIHYATILSLACASALALLVIKNDIFAGAKSKIFLGAAVIATLGGLASSQTRGVWVAFIAACVIVFSVYSLKRGLVIAAALAATVVLALAFSEPLKERAGTIITAIKTQEDPTRSASQRLELWRGAWVIFKEHPIGGTGIGDFQADIKRMIAEGKIKPLMATSHGHNIYMHWLSTQGAVGLFVLTALLSSITAWGIGIVKRRRSVGGYIIVLTTALIIMGGMTETNIGISKIFAAYCLTIGLFGGLQGGPGDKQKD